MEIKNKCQFCGSEKTVIGKQSGYASVRPNKAFSLREQQIYHIICLNCGSIIRSYVENPKELLTK